MSSTKLEIARDLTIAYIEHRSSSIVKDADAITEAFEKFYDVVNRCASVGNYPGIKYDELLKKED